jgi:hypothetical protein
MDDISLVTGNRHRDSPFTWQKEQRWGESLPFEAFAVVFSLPAL